MQFLEPIASASWEDEAPRQSAFLNRTDGTSDIQSNAEKQPRCKNARTAVKPRELAELALRSPYPTVDIVATEKYAASVDDQSFSSAM